jgi:hypothetical protein
MMAAATAAEAHRSIDMPQALLMDFMVCHIECVPDVSASCPVAFIYGQYAFRVQAVAVAQGQSTLFSLLL